MHGELDREIYMNVPKGFEASLKKNRICKLKKYDMVSNMQELGLGDLPNNGYHTLFIK